MTYASRWQILALIAALFVISGVQAQTSGGDCLDCTQTTSDAQLRRCVVLAVASSLQLQGLGGSEGDTVTRLMQSPCEYVRSDSSDPDPCSLVPGKIVCVDAGKGIYIHGIYVSQFRLGGNLPAQLSFATNLQDLRIDGGKIEGTLPPDWSTLQNLKSMVLRGNKLDGTLPPAWKQLRSLTELNLAGNELSGKLPKEWKELTQLRSLDFSDNRFSGGIPEDWATLDLHSVEMSDNPRMRSEKCPYWYNMTTLDLGSTRLTCEPGPRKKYCLDNKKRLGQQGQQVVLRDFRGDMCSNEDRNLRLGLAWGLFGFIAMCICINTITQIFLLKRKQMEPLGGSIKGESEDVVVEASSESGDCQKFKRCCQHRFLLAVWKYKDPVVAGWDVISDALLAYQVYPNWPFYLIGLTMFLPDFITCACILLNLTREQATPTRLFAVLLGLPLLAPTLPLMLLLAVLQHQLTSLRCLPNVFHHVSAIRTVELLHWMVGFIEAPALAVLTSCIYYIGNKPEIGWFIDWRIFFVSLASAFLDMLLHMWRIQNLILQHISSPARKSLYGTLGSLFTDLHLPAEEDHTPHLGLASEMDKESVKSVTSEASTPHTVVSHGGDVAGGVSNVTAMQQVANAISQVAVTAANAV